MGFERRTGGTFSTFCLFRFEKRTIVKLIVSVLFDYIIIIQFADSINFQSLWTIDPIEFT